jgi:DNA-binding MarR family transcriptional regulator
VPTEADYREAAQLRSALQVFLRSSEQVVRRHGLTPERYILLLCVKAAAEAGEGTTIKELRKQLHLAQSSVTELVRRAEDLGLIERELSRRDARVSHLSLSREGERRLAGAVGELSGERAKLLSVVTELTQDASRDDGQ